MAIVHKVPPGPLDPAQQDPFYRAWMLRTYRGEGDLWALAVGHPFSEQGILDAQKAYGMTARQLAMRMQDAEHGIVTRIETQKTQAAARDYVATHQNNDVVSWIVHHDPIASFVDSIEKGTPIDQAFQKAGDAIADNVRDVGPYVQTAVSFIPGFGTVAAAAIGGAVALAKGEPIADALIDTFGGALPGGAVTQMALRAGVTAIQDAAEGKTLDEIGLDAARHAIPEGPARMAFDAGVAIMGAALSQRSPTAAAAIQTAAADQGAPNASLPPPRRLPSPAQIKAYAHAAEIARRAHQPPPRPAVPPAKGTPLPVLGPARALSATGPGGAGAAVAIAGLVVAGAALYRFGTR